MSSDADRLRAAAHILDTVSHPTPFSTTCAALLRAVAEEGDHDERISGFQLWPNTYDAALALADVILGDNDE